MTTIDNLLTKISNYGFDHYTNVIKAKDLKVLKSLSTSVCLPSFITENQSKLLLKVLSEHAVHFLSVDQDVDKILSEKLWSKSFRQVEQIRKIYISNPIERYPQILVEFTHHDGIRKALHRVATSPGGHIGRINNSSTQYDLTEYNIVTLLDALKPYKFNIDEKLKNYYEIIKKYEISEVRQAYTFESLVPDNLKKQLEIECGPTDSMLDTIKEDRKLRYQFFVKNSPKIQENVTSQIIHRQRPRVWIDSNSYSLTEIISALKTLDRFPVLVVFDSHLPDGPIQNLQNFSKSLEENNILNNIGIYFRLDNSELGKQFNTFIGDKKYNSMLNENTQVAGVLAGKLPKFFLKNNGWAPKSVIALGTNLRHSKTAIYSNRCDLIISYSEKESIIETTTAQWRK
jgi:hypothetical protein